MSTHPPHSNTHHTHHIPTPTTLTTPLPPQNTQLLQWHKRRTTPLTPGEVRLYQVAPQSQWAPGFLVARALKPGGTELLDQRGAFLMHTATCVYIWQGEQCPAVMVTDAHHLAAQLVRYEALGVGMQHVLAGQEPEEVKGMLQAATETAQRAQRGADAKKVAAEVEKRMAAYDAAYKVCWLCV